VHEGPAFPLGKKGGFAGTHILVPRGGVAVHINAFNFPVWGLLEKFAPSFLAGMPCIGKPATATSYLTEALMRLIVQSGILPEGSLQLVIGGTGDLLDRLEGPDVVTFTGSADTAAKLRVHPNLVRQSIPFNAEADSLNCAILAPDVTPDDEEFDLFVKEVAREMTTKAGQKCTAIRRAIVPRQHLDAVAERLRARLAKTSSAIRRAKTCAWAPSPRTRRRPMWPNVSPRCCRAPSWSTASATASRPWATAWPKARSSRPRCC
jgi:oxepin-CoA hydrolase/3-oxo-5,6-dehydrosuberyl-CoA semialdehyde dehydrogenase